jgi:glutaminase
MSGPGHSYICICAGHRARSSGNAPGLCLLSAALLLVAATAANARGPLGAREADYQLAVTQAYQRYRSEPTGKIAEPIAALSAVPGHYAVVVVRIDGKIWEQGDARIPFVLAAMAAPFTAALAAQQRGPELLNSTAGAVAGTAPVPPGRNVADWGPAPHASFGPEGSIATLSLVQPQHDADGKWRALLENFNKFAGAELSVDDRAYRGTTPVVPRVPQLTRELASDGRLTDDVESTADLYLRQNSVAVTARHLAIMAATLANDGVNPVGGQDGGERRGGREHPGSTHGRPQGQQRVDVEGGYRSQCREQRRNLCRRARSTRHRRVFTAAGCVRRQCARTKGHQVPVAGADVPVRA